MPLKFKTKQQAERFFRRLDKKIPLPFDGRFEKIEKNLYILEKRVDAMMGQLLRKNILKFVKEKNNNQFLIKKL